MESVLCGSCHLSEPSKVTGSDVTQRHDGDIQQRCRVGSVTSSTTSSGVSSCSSPEALSVKLERMHNGDCQSSRHTPLPLARVYRTKVMSRAETNQSATGVRSPGDPVAKRRVKLIFSGNNKEEQMFLRNTYKSVLDYIDPRCKWIEFRKDPLVQNYSLDSTQAKTKVTSLRMPSLCLTLLLQEKEILGCDRLKMASSHFDNAPWKFHHKELVKAHRITAYPYNSQDYFIAEEDLPLCSIRQVHGGEEFLRLTRFVKQRNWLDTINMYRLLLNQDPNCHKADFCAFNIGSSGHYSVQLALKKLPKGVSVRGSERALLVFRVADIGSLVPLLPIRCRQLHDGLWATRDLDGNQILIDVVPAPKIPRKSRRSSSAQSVSSVASVIMDTAMEFLLDESGSFPSVFGSPPCGEASPDLAREMEFILQDLEADAADVSSGSSTLRDDEVCHSKKEVCRSKKPSINSLNSGLQTLSLSVDDPQDGSNKDSGYRTGGDASSPDANNPNPTRQQSVSLHKHTDSGLGEDRSDGDSGSGHSPASINDRSLSERECLDLVTDQVNVKANRSPWKRGGTTRQSCVQGPPSPFYPGVIPSVEDSVQSNVKNSEIPALQITHLPTTPAKENARLNPCLESVMENVKSNQCLERTMEHDKIKSCLEPVQEDTKRNHQKRVVTDPSDAEFGLKDSSAGSAFTFPGSVDSSNSGVNPSRQTSDSGGTRCTKGRIPVKSVVIPSSPPVTDSSLEGLNGPCESEYEEMAIDCPAEVLKTSTPIKGGNELYTQPSSKIQNNTIGITGVIPKQHHVGKSSQSYFSGTSTGKSPKERKHGIIVKANPRDVGGSRNQTRTGNASIAPFGSQSEDSKVKEAFVYTSATSTNAGEIDTNVPAAPGVECPSRQDTSTLELQSDSVHESAINSPTADSSQSSGYTQDVQSIKESTPQEGFWI